MQSNHNVPAVLIPRRPVSQSQEKRQSPGINQFIEIIIPRLLHDGLGTDGLERLDDLLGVLLGHGLLEDLGHRFDELLAVNQGEAEEGLDLLDDLGLGGGVNGLEFQVEEGLLLGGRSSLFLLSGSSGGSSTAGHGETANGEVGDVEAGLEGGHEVGGLQQRQCADLVNNLADLGVDRGSSLRLGGLPSPCPLRQVCRGREAQRSGGWADDLPAAASGDLRRN